MAKIKYIGNYPQPTRIQGIVCRPGDTIDIHPIHALSYMGAKDFKVKFDAEDEETLSKVHRLAHIKRLNKEFGGQGLDEALERAFPKAKKSAFSRKIAPKNPAVKKTPAKKPAAKKEPKKEELKPPIEKKEPAKKAAPKAKKPTKDSEL